jgi:hypothetical protein
MNIINENDKKKNNLVKVLKMENNKKKKFLFIFLIIILYFTFILNLFLRKKKTQNIVKEINLKNEKIRKDKSKNNFLQILLINEAKMPHLNEIIKKRIFKIRLPLPKEIKCTPHLGNKELFYLFK